MSNIYSVATEFLERTRKHWTPAPDVWLASLSDDENKLVRGIEQFGLEGDFRALSDIVLGCHNKYQFAKTWRLLRNDSEKTFRVYSAGNANYSPELNRIMREVSLRIIKRKHDAMAEWFFIRWADRSDTAGMKGLGHDEYRKLIERYAGGGVGCVLVCATVLGGCSGVCFLAWLLARC
ncbi:MAG TPA: hypothetical protein VGY55_24680 [Pirellulales bacterium]|jgi:hypothetical protein|nr:hypothetical protein [Pirellulales bacterium]